MIVQQTQNALNDKLAQFILIPLGGAVAVSMPVETYAGLLISLPFVLFAPLAGWVGDRYSKRDVMLGAAVAQLAILIWISWAVGARQLGLAMSGFFALAAQSAFFSPAKFGITKELVGSRHVGFGASLQQMTAMLAILAGQILAGWWFDVRYREAGGVPEVAWAAARLPLWVLTATAVPTLLLALIIPRVPAQGGGPLTPGLLVGHFIGLADLWRRPGLRRASFGVAFFWGFAAFINLWSVKLAKFMTAGGPGFGTLSSQFMAAASLGMAVGFGVAAWMLRRRIELGWVPVAGLGMALLACALAFISPESWTFLALLVALSFCAAIFLSPLNAWLQDTYPADKRGELQASVNLQDCLAGIIAVATLQLIPMVLEPCGVPPWLVYRLEIGAAGLLCVLMTWFIIRLLPGDFMRVLGISLVRSIYHLRAVNPDRLPASGGVLLLPNHVTWADSFFISAACRRPVRFVMDEAFMARPAIRWFVSLFDTVTIRRDQPREAIRIVIEGLRAGDVMCLFPEGQLTRTGSLCRLQRGCELIARKAGHPLIPLWCDGSWGSIFSFERGRFFRKWPYRLLRHEIRSAFGEALDPATVTLAGLREALGKAAAEAHEARFHSAAWSHRVPHRDRDRWLALSPETRRRLWINGYQAGQLQAIRRHRPFFALAAETAAGTLPAGFSAFSRLFKADLTPCHQCHGNGGDWVGGDTLRGLLETTPPDGKITFYDFSSRSLQPLAVPGVRHCPCLAVGGLIIAMSMPDPPLTAAHQDAQTGTKPGSYGKLLPGWFTSRDPDGSLRAHGPAAPADGTPLPGHLTLDDEGYLEPAAEDK
jgi:acyl-[acyl-carrier-protein]-phospholipid O-acyltransferase/long-chain-fatty-acid--[acyl-carrier-protein] ligase